jgi:hypothetical protein
VEGQEIISRITQLLFQFKLKDYTLYDNGTAEYVLGGAGNNTNMTIKTTHSYVPRTGYSFDNATGTIITPEGKQLVISTVD